MAFNEATKEIPRKFISTEKNHARVLSDDATVQEARLVVLPGELFHLVCTTDDNQPGQEALFLMSLDRASVLMETDTRFVREISNYMAELLLPVDRPRRLGLLNEHRQNLRLEEFMQVEPGTGVTVSFDNMPFPGVVYCHGLVPEKGPGIWFGVWLIHHAGQGDSDGSVSGKRYFTCNPDCAVFVTVADVVLRNESNSSSDGTRLAIGERSPQNPSPQCNTNALALGGNSPGKRGQSPTESKSIVNLLHGAVNVAANAIGFHKGSQSPRSEFSRSQVFVNSNLAPKASTSIPSPPVFQSSGAVPANPSVDCVPFKLNDRVCFLQDKGDPEIATVRWIGWLSKEPGSDLYAGIQFDKPVGSGTGQFNGDQIFVTPPNHAAIVPVISLLAYEEAQERAHAQSCPLRVQPQIVKKPSYSECANRPPQNSHAGLPSLENAADASKRSVQPAAVSSLSSQDVSKPSSGPNPRLNSKPSHPVPQLHPASLRRIDDRICSGRARGIQGHRNSCYVDATLFSMFAFTDVFDEILHRPRRKRDIHGYDEVQCALREGIVSPLRNTMYVPCVDVMRLRELMDEFGNVTGLTDEERDPEEFLTSLFQQILKIDPLLKLTTGDCNWYTLFVEKDQMHLIPTVQQLFDGSLVTSSVRFKEVPKCLLLLAPRSGTEYKMYRYIYPSAVLDITDAIAGYPRQCSFCQEKEAEFECKECYNWMHLEGETRSALSTMAFCKKCSAKRHQRYPKHKPYKIQTTLALLPQEQVRMELFAVVCIKASNNIYVSYAKDGNSLWYLMDSMADRECGEGACGSNIPEIRACPDFNEYLDLEFGHKRLMEYLERHLQPPESVRTICEDCYIFMYQPIGLGRLDAEKGQASDVTKMHNKVLELERKLQALQQEHRRVCEERHCKICLDKNVDVAFQSCGHLSCSNCSRTLHDCPVCRKSISAKIKLFFN
ncbi:ubiquitin carboxyl-terminal hydrolase CYLD-like [Paramacrobiotus metropolitanus]|uniref:ubiquitin carboxyl-terminal hydrolase CYLD-like n=1 Tax=Paramacrobiotus metropolitanus TaxID=2943436 RepID=UPI002445A6FB|nr:ubiquitin carboxyl-terminal hydrolase CYLD-like [Paramacrobiotus metropolitanus]